MIVVDERCVDCESYDCLDLLVVVFPVNLCFVSKEETLGNDYFFAFVVCENTWIGGFGDERGLKMWATEMVTCWRFPNSRESTEGMVVVAIAMASTTLIGDVDTDYVWACWVEEAMQLAHACSYRWD
jgi:hypothetical protein